MADTTAIINSAAPADDAAPRRPAPPLPVPTPGMVAAIAGVLLSAAGLLALLVRFWGINSDYTDRFIIVLATGWLFWNARTSLAPPRPSPLGLVPLLIGAAAAVPAYYLAAQVGPRSILLWWAATAWALSAAGFLLIAGGWQWLWRLKFPLAFLFFALPIPDRIEVPLQDALKGRTTGLAEWGLQATGMPVHRMGNELHLPSGALEVVEACSGVRSITALLAIAVFVSHLRGFGLVRGLIMFALAIPIIAAVNALRIVLTGWIQEWFGPEWIQGNPHEYLGMAMVLVGLVLVMTLSYLMRSRGPAEPETDPPPFPGFAATRLAWPAALILLAGAGASAWAFATGMARTQQEVQNVPMDRLPLTIGEWVGQEVPIPESIREILTYDRATCRVYRDKIGNTVQVWVIYWQATTAIRGYHHPDICCGSRGWRRAAEGELPVRLKSGALLNLTTREFERDRERKKLFFWTQEGRHVYSQQDMEAEDQTGPGHRWIRDRLVPRPPEMLARVTVLIETETWGNGTRSEEALKKFTREFADVLYELCPWATPEEIPPKREAASR